MNIKKYTPKGLKEDLNSHTVYVGEITFVEPFQSDYEELYEMYNVDSRDANQNNPHFCTIHSIQYTTTCDSNCAGVNIDKIEEEGDSYIVPDLYYGIIIWEVNRNNYFMPTN